jgi:hypothetical protein
VNEKFETAVATSTNHAFNVGCSVSFLPLGALVVLVLILSKLNWVVTLVAAVFAVLTALGLATLVASISRKNASDQTYRLHIDPEIERNLGQLNLTRPEFNRLAVALLPSEAALRNYLSAPSPLSNTGPDPAPPEP